MSYKLNSKCVLFLPKIDPINDFETIIFSARDYKVIKINKIGYRLLAYIKEKPDATLPQLGSKLSVNPTERKKFEQFLKLMLQEKILTKK